MGWESLALRTHYYDNITATRIQVFTAKPLLLAQVLSDKMNFNMFHYLTRVDPVVGTPYEFIQ